MHASWCERGDGDRPGQSVWFRPGGHGLTFQRISIFILAVLFAGQVHAQSSGGLGCSDPLMSGTLECAGQSPEGSQLGTQPGSGEGYGPGSGNVLAPSSLTSNLSPQAAGPSNYSDVERLSHPATPQRASSPAEQLTEFQRFAASTTGLVLPIYGANLFQSVPSTFAPMELSPVPSDYVVGPGDELRIRIWGQVSRQANVRVDRSGEIFLPEVGQVHVAGLTFSELDAHLRQAVGRVYRNFDLTVDMGQIRAIQVYVSGEARRPGVYTVSSLSTLVDALFASGGPSVEGSMRSIELRRGGSLVTRFDVYDLLIRGDKSKDAKLLPGDIIFIPPVNSRVAVFGSIRNPAIYELRPQETLSEFLNDAGGVSSIAEQARVSIERIDEHRDRHAMEVAYDAQGLATPLTDGDIIRVYSIVPKYQKTVTLRGNTVNPGRFAWHEGMHVSDLIPDKSSLLTRNYWWHRAQLGLPAPEFESVPGLGERRQPSENRPLPLSQNAQPGVSQAIGSNGPSPQERAQSTSHAPLATEETANPNQTMLQGERTDVQLSAPEIDWDYAAIERLAPETLKTQLLPFDLGKLVLQHDTSQDLALQPGDVVYIFSQGDISVPVAEQTKLVRLDGEFAHAGIYAVGPGETLRHLVERVGGLTSNAYLYGSEFTRVSTRVVQQARIDEYVQSLTMGIERSAMMLAASSAASTSQGLASGAAMQSSEQNLINSLKGIRATGRIVLSMHPDSSGVNDLPDVVLEDGDRFVVPHFPATVNVVGSVYDQNSFLFADHAHVGTYMRLAGGTSKDADCRREFVIRADGSVVSRDTTRGAWGDEFNNLRIYPGDTIVVPEKLPKWSALYGFMSWSQVFSQLALGAAAVNVIR